MGLRNATVYAYLDYQFTVQPGVYWAGDPGLMFPDAAEALAEGNAPALFDVGGGERVPLFRLASDAPAGFSIDGQYPVQAPTGYVTVVAAPSNEPTPAGCVSFAVLTPTVATVEGAVLTVHGECTIDGESDPYWAVKLPSPPIVRGADPHLRVSACTLGVYLPPGAYWVGDLCPNFAGRAWERCLSDNLGFHAFTGNVGGETVIAIPLETPQATLVGSDGNVFPCSRHFGVMEARRVPPMGGVHTYRLTDGGFLRWRDGVFDFAGVKIQ